LIWSDSLLRRRDLAEVIGAALASKAMGAGHRAAVVLVGVPPSTVRGWFRRFAANADAIRVWFTVLAHNLDPMLAPVAPTGTPVGDAVEAVAVAARAAALRLGTMAPWSFASSASGGRLLSQHGLPLGGGCLSGQCPEFCCSRRQEARCKTAAETWRCSATR